MNTPVWLFFAGSGENRVSQPVGPCLARGANSGIYLLRFFTAQTHGKDRCKGVLFWNPRPANFLRHRQILFVYKKCLTSFYLLFTKSLVSNFETQPCQQSARTSLERLADQRHPARTGAGDERLAMTAQEHQDAFVPEQLRSLKIQPVGDFWRKKVKPQILLSGKWLEKAGFKPGHRVQVIVQPGLLTLRFQDQGSEVTL